MKLTRRKLLTLPAIAAVAVSAEVVTNAKTEYGLVGVDVFSSRPAFFCEELDKPKYNNLPWEFSCLLLDKTRTKKFEGVFIDSDRGITNWLKTKYFHCYKLTSPYGKDEKLDAFLPVSFCKKHNIYYATTILI